MRLPLSFRLALITALSAAALTVVATSSPTATAQSAVQGGYFNPTTPQRVLDTRKGTGGVNGPLTSGQTIAVRVTGVGTVPAGAMAVAMNVTAVDPTGSGFLTVWPSDAAQPEVSSVNFDAGQTIPNLVQMRPGADGFVRITTRAPAVHVLVDINGYYSTTGGSRYSPKSPARVLDTRDTNDPIAPRDFIEVEFISSVNANYTARAFNLTVVAGGAPGYVTVYPGDLTSPPDASNLNFRANQTVANFVITGMSPQRTYNIFNASDSPIHVIIDGYGVYANSGVSANADGKFVPLTPTRILDTRSNIGVGGNGPMVIGQPRLVSIANTGGIPPAVDVIATVVNLTATQPSHDGWIRMWNGSTEPETSNVNFRPGQTIANHAAITLPSELSFANVRNSDGATHLIVDATGYFQLGSGNDLL